MFTAVILALQMTIAVPVDTPPPSAAPVHRARPKAVEVSDWYNRRLTVHRALSYATVPLFAFQYAAGRRIWSQGAGAPDWARTGHRIGAATLAGVFTVNTVTGLWNLWDSRSVEQGRALRYIHALSMLTADAGFTWAGARLSEQAETSFDKRKLHRTVALSSIGITLVSGVMMKILNQ